MGEKAKSVPSESETGARLKKFGIAAAVLLGVFLLGYVPSCQNALSAERQRARLERQYNLARLHSQLGMVSFEANRNNYSKAAEYSTEFFNNLKSVTGRSGDASSEEKLQAVSARRDEITAQLAQAEPAVKEKLSQMYADFYQLVLSP